MNLVWAGAAVLVLAALGFGLGAKRSVLLTFAASVGAGTAFAVAATRVGATLLQQAAAALGACAVAGWAVRWAAGRGLGRVRLPGDRWLGAGLGVAQAALLVWFCAATAPRVAAPPGPATDPAAGAATALPQAAGTGGSAASWLDGPIATVRAVRTLATLTPAEARLVYDVPEVRAVADSEPMRPLWEDVALVEQAGQAARGSRFALLAVGSDPRVKAALDDPDFLAKVRRVDLVALADRVARCRAGAGADGGGGK